MNDPIDESGILQAVAAANDRLPASVLIPPGDDMALLEVGTARLLVAVDQVVSGVHFVAATPIDLIARKAIARNVSDVAAMAGIPVATLASATLPREMSQQSAQQLLESVRRFAEEFGAPLIGGDTAVHKAANAPLVLSVTILARPRADGMVITRQGARAGDKLIVSGPLGGSFGADGLGRHLTFLPRTQEAQALVDQLGSQVHAMIDISDGLGCDCARMMRASSKHGGSSLQARLDADRIPCHGGVPVRDAVGDGEDHELLAAIDGGAAVPFGFTMIGEVCARPVEEAPLVALLVGDDLEDATDWGWNHA
ncbi:MAG: thiamine-monophosphate kinase [Phycisphaerales bacterium]|nr:thiamine-monophosphate kinase [Phycisphaerales bacterium]